MIIDSSLEMADNAAVPTAGTITSPLVIGQSIDLRPLVADNATVDLSAGEPIYLVIEVTDPIVGDASFANYRFRAYTHTASVTAPTSSPGSEILSTGNTAKALLVTGKRWIYTLPETVYERWLMITGSANGGAVTGGNINAYLTKDVTNWTSTNTRTG
tara:strand:- start:26 stop:499 length:474 start_codon:yes stop_codon:yes gene_type:complete